MKRPRRQFGQHIRLIDRRSGIVPGRRFAVLAGVGVAWLACGGGAAWGDSVEATIYEPGGPLPTESIDLASCTRDVAPAPIVQYGPNGITDPGTIGSLPAWSIADLLSCLNPVIAPSAVKQLYVVKNATTVEAPLTAADLTVPSDFQPNTEVPLIYDSDGTITYLRPRRSYGDLNLLDKLDANQSNSPFQFEVWTGRVIPVTLVASSSTVPQGGTVTFNAEVSASSANLSYNWSFGNSGAADLTTTSNQATATFATPGTYTVEVQAVDLAAGSSGADQVTVTVTGGPPPQPTLTTTPTSPTGPAGSRGAVPRQGPGKSSSKTPGRSGSNHRRSATTGHADEHKPTKQTTSTRPSLGASSPATGAGLGASNGNGSTGAADHASPTSSSGTRSPTPVQGQTPARPSELHGIRVDGRLISDVRLVSAARSPLVHALPAPGGTAPVLRRPSGPSPLAALAAGLGAILLFALGAGRELRWLLGRPVLHVGR